MNGLVLTHREERREVKVIRFPCPNCGVGPGKPCDFGYSTKGFRLRSPCSHTGRYLAAVDAKLVPALPGGWHG